MTTALAPLAIVACLSGCAEASLDESLRKAIEHTGVPFQLEVNCATPRSRRALTVYGGDVAIWNGALQVRLDQDDRRALLAALLESGFSGFESRYGEQVKADKQEAPLRVHCRIHLQIDRFEKTSVQLLDGAPSPDLLGLAASLLDVVDARAETDGIGVTGLEDGLAKLSSGELAPEVLELRMVRLTDTAADGVIVRIRGGSVLRQPYVPGNRVGDAESTRLDDCRMREVVGALVASRAWLLPRNLQRDDITELEFGVLGARRDVLARPSFRRVDAAAGERLDALVDRIQRLSSTCGAPEDRPRTFDSEDSS